MADQSFERLLERLFDETPVFADAPLFAAARRERGWTAAGTCAIF